MGVKIYLRGSSSEMPKLTLSVYPPAAKKALKVPVELRGFELSRAHLYVSRSFPNGTTVLLEYGHRRASGMIENCRQESAQFELVVLTTQDGDWLLELLKGENNFDPGPLTLDKCMSAEELSQLIACMGESSHIAQEHRS
jgi:hypothetical protein